MKKERNNDDALKQEAPTLFGITKQNNFKVPDGYFDALPEMLVEKRSASTPGVLERLLHAFHWKVAVPTFAAVAVILFVIFNTSPMVEDTAIASISVEEVEAYLDNEGLYTIDEDMLLEALEDEVAVNYEEDNDEIVEYLLENNIELETILEEL